MGHKDKEILWVLGSTSSVQNLFPSHELLLSPLMGGSPTTLAPLLWVVLLLSLMNVVLEECSILFSVASMYRPGTV